MEINMNNIQLVKDSDGWIYLSKDGQSSDIKLIYDDGRYSDIEKLQKRIRYIENWNALNNENNGIAFYEFYTDEIWNAVAKN